MCQAQAAEFNDSAREVFFQYSIFKCSTCLKFVHKEKFVSHSQACSQQIKISDQPIENTASIGFAFTESISKSQITGFESGLLTSDAFSSTVPDLNGTPMHDQRELPITTEQISESRHPPPFPGEAIDIQDASDSQKKDASDVQKRPLKHPVTQNSQKNDKRFSLVNPAQPRISSLRESNSGFLQKKNDHTNKNVRESTREISRSVDRRHSSRDVQSSTNKTVAIVSNSANSKANNSSAVKSNSNQTKPPQKYVKPPQKVTSAKEHDLPVVIGSRISIRDFKPVLQANRPAKPPESKPALPQNKDYSTAKSQDQPESVEQNPHSNSKDERMPILCDSTELPLNNEKSANEIPVIQDPENADSDLPRKDSSKYLDQPLSQSPVNFSHEYIKMVDLNGDDSTSEKNAGGEGQGDVLVTNPAPTAQPKSYEDLRAKFKQRKIQNDTGEGKYSKEINDSQANFDSKPLLPLLQRPTNSERFVKVAHQRENATNSMQMLDSEGGIQLDEKIVNAVAIVHHDLKPETNFKATVKTISARTNPRIPVSNEGSFRKKLQNLRKSLIEPNFQRAKSPKLSEEMRLSYDQSNPKNDREDNKEPNMRQSRGNRSEFISQNTFNIVLNINQKSESQTLNIQSQVLAKPSEPKQQTGGSVLRPPTTTGSKSRSFVGKGR